MNCDLCFGSRVSICKTISYSNEFKRWGSCFTWSGGRWCLGAGAVNAGTRLRHTEGTNTYRDAWRSWQTVQKSEILSLNTSAICPKMCKYHALLSNWWKQIRNCRGGSRSILYCVITLTISITSRCKNLISRRTHITIRFGGKHKGCNLEIDVSQNSGIRYRRFNLTFDIEWSNCHIVPDIEGHFRTLISKVAPSISGYKDIEGPTFDFEGQQGSRCGAWRWNTMSYDRYMTDIWYHI